MVVAGMQASIDERHLKDFVRLLQCASRYGDELCIHANQSRWELAVTNSNQSAFCLFKLDPQFFSRYRALGTPSERRKGIKCKLLVKSVLAVLGKPSAVSSIERLDLRIHDGDNDLRAVSSSASTNSGTGSNDTNGTPQRSDTGFGDDDDDPINSLGSVLIIRLVCKHGITKKHTLNLSSTDFVRVDIDPNSTPSSFTISARTLRNWLEHFSLTSSSVQTANNLAKMENQLGWMFGKHEVRLKSWEGVNKDLCTEIKVDVAEFGSDRDGRASYWVEQERVDLTLPMREFRATLQLADSMNIDLTVAFSLPTQPLTMIYEGGDEDNFDIFCAIATMHCDAFPTDFDKPNIGQQPQAQSKSLDPKGRRIVSDLTDDGGGGGGGGRDGPEQAEGSKRARTDQSQGSQKRRSVSRLDLTASQKQATMASVVHNSQPGSSQRGQTQPGNQNQGDGETSQQERLFGPGASQEDDYNPPQSQGGSRQVMTQEEVMKLAGMEGIDMESLVDEMDDAEDEEWTASQQAQVQAHHNGEVGAPEEWNEGDFQDEGMTGGGEGFQPDNSVFDEPEFIPPASTPSQPPVRRPLAERTITPIATSGRFQVQTEIRGEGGKGKGRAMTEAAPLDRPSLPAAQNRRENPPLAASRSEPGPRNKSPVKEAGKFQARVRSETEEERHTSGGIPGGNGRRASSVGRQPLGDLKMGEDEELDDSDDEGLGPSQAVQDIPRLFKD